MSRVSVSKSGVRPVASNASLERHIQRFLELRRDLAQIEYFCKGTVLKRMMKCGKAQCACASDATKRHGPYFELTYKAAGKTVNGITPVFDQSWRLDCANLAYIPGLSARRKQVSWS
jgi:hypothetical protein